MLSKTPEMPRLSKQMSIWRYNFVIFSKLCFLKCLFTFTEKRFPIDHLLPGKKKKTTAMDSEFFMKLLYLSNSETNSNSFWGLWEKVKESCYKAEANLVRKTSVSCRFLCLFPSAALWMNQMFCLTEDLIKRTKCVKFHRHSSKFRWNIITCTIAQQNH